jgi:Flp pilus assembly protein TadB
MWTFFTVIFVMFFLFIYELSTDVQAKQNREEDERLKKVAEENATIKASNEAEKRRLASERAKIVNKTIKISAREKANQNHLTVSQLVIYSSVFIAIAIAIILFFKNISPI